MEILTRRPLFQHHLELLLVTLLFERVNFLLLFLHLCYRTGFSGFTIHINKNAHKETAKTGLSCFEIIRRIQEISPPGPFFVEVTFEQPEVSPVIVVKSIGVGGMGYTLAQRSINLNYNATVTENIVLRQY